VGQDVTAAAGVVVLETESLRVRPFSIDDAEFICFNFNYRRYHLLIAPAYVFLASVATRQAAA
jgi:hypothetical protein